MAWWRSARGVFAAMLRLDRQIAQDALKAMLVGVDSSKLHLFCAIAGSKTHDLASLSAKSMKQENSLAFAWRGLVDGY